MPLSAAQMIDLTRVVNVYGRQQDGRVLYRVLVSDRVAFGRIQELTHLVAPTVPPWYILSHDGTGWWLLTTEPAWFIELEQEIIRARL